MAETLVPTVSVYGEFSPREFQHLGVNPIEAAMKEFVKEESLTAAQTYSNNAMVVLFGTYAPKNSQNFRAGGRITGEDVEIMVGEELAGIDTSDVLADVSVSIQHVPHAHGHYGAPKLEAGYYVGIDVFSITSGSVFVALSQNYNYGMATILSQGNGFHCNKRALNQHAPNAFIPYARLPSAAHVHAIAERLLVSGCKHIEEYSRVMFEFENNVPPKAIIDEKEAFTELESLALDKNIKYNRICVSRLH